MNPLSIEELQAMSDADLNALAAELRGWHIGGLLGKEEIDVWCTGEKSPQDNYERQIRVADWTPATNRNQSGELLKYASTQGVKIDVCFRPNCEYVTMWARVPLILKTIQGNDARAETVAFCVAMLAIKKGE